MDRKEIERRMEVFEWWARYFQKELGLLSARIVIRLSEDGEDEGANAFWVGSEEDMAYAIYCVKKWISNKDTDDKEIAQVAFHEVYETSFHEIRWRLLMDHSGDVVERLTHSHVCRMENVLFPHLYQCGREVRGGK